MPDPKKRNVLTPAQRVAKLEADLAEAKAKADAKGRKRASELREQRTKLQGQITERELKVKAIDAELETLPGSDETGNEAASDEAKG